MLAGEALRVERVAVLLGRVCDQPTVAETKRGLLLREGNYPPTVYVPRADVEMSLLSRVTHSTHCPFKGDASYYDFTGDGPVVEQLAWSYEDPFDQMEAIRDHLSFYTDRAEIEPLDG